MSHYQIRVRMYGGTYMASCTGLRASCTSGPFEAARALALKVIHRDGGNAVSLTESSRGPDKTTFDLKIHVPGERRGA